MSPKSLKIIHARMNTGHFCKVVKGMKIRLPRNLPSDFVRGESMSVAISLGLLH